MYAGPGVSFFSLGSSVWLSMSSYYCLWVSPVTAVLISPVKEFTHHTDFKSVNHGKYDEYDVALKVNHASSVTFSAKPARGQSKERWIT